MSVDGAVTPLLMDRRNGDKLLGSFKDDGKSLKKGMEYGRTVLLGPY